ncbi:Amino acid permease [Arachis hypogaea]|nr:Amino acid permease [Arachis hypogaea]
MMFATRISIATTTTFYVLCGCIGYGAFGNSAPGNLLTAFDNPIWLIDIANLALVIHFVGAYQVYSQPLFAFVEEHASKRWPSLEIEHKVEIPFLPSFKLNKLRLVWRSFFVVVTTFISMLVPFFNDIMGVIGALGFWPLTVYFPVEMYIKQMKIQKWSEKWIGLQCLSMFCLLVTLAALVGSVVGVLLDLSKFKAFSSQL